jgi:hypothetical protein
MQSVSTSYGLILVLYHLHYHALPLYSPLVRSSLVFSHYMMIATLLILQFEDSLLLPARILSDLSFFEAMFHVANL